MIAIDTETVSLEDRTLVGFSVADDKGAKYYPIAHNKIPNVDADSARKMLQELVQKSPIVFHNSSFDIPVLVSWGINFDKTVINDTLIIGSFLGVSILTRQL